MHNQLYIGLMSGTSMDGIDAALLDFSQQQIRLLHHHSHPIPDTLRSRILNLAHNTADLDVMGETDAELGHLFAEAANTLLQKSGFNSQQIIAIGSHGQTIRHRPDLAHAFTLQIGDPNRIAYHTGITTVADFRRKDMAAGGQGAPLVPAFHQAWLKDESENRVVVNIGGIANITVLAQNQPALGFDTGPGNLLMDAWIQLHHQQPFDENGTWAASALADPAVVGQMMRDPFILQSPPKSTGREHYHLDWLKQQLQPFPQLDAACIQASLCQFTAQSIHAAIRQHAPETQRVIVCGGGARNQHLMQQLQDLLQPALVESSETHGIHPDWVEAAAFAWLAKQTLEHKPGNMTAVTGASRNVILGGIYLA